MALETLRNMSKSDAETFHKLASFAVIDSDGGNPFIPNKRIQHSMLFIYSHRCTVAFAH